jgi:MFS family permease
VLSALRAVASLLIGAGILMLGNGLLGIVLPIRLNAADLATEVTGLVMAGYYAGLVLGAMYGKNLIARVGHIRAFAAFAAIAAAAALSHALWFDAITWTALRVITGFCSAGLFAAIESWINERSSNELRGRVLSLYMVTTYFSLGASQMLVNLWDIQAAQLFMLPAILICLSLVPVVMTRVAAPDIGVERPLGLRALYAISPLAVAGAFGSGLSQGSIYGMGAVFADDIGLSVFQVSLFMGCAVCGGLVLQWPIGRLSDRFDRRTVLVWVLAALALSSLVMAAVVAVGREAPPLLAVLGLIPLLAGMSSCIYPIAVAQAFDYVERNRMVGASSTLLLAYAVGATGGPFVAAVLMSHIGPEGLFISVTVIAGALAGFALHRMGRRAAAPNEDQTGFVAVPATSTIAGQLDPRTEPTG